MKRFMSSQSDRRDVRVDVPDRWLKGGGELARVGWIRKNRRSHSKEPSTEAWQHERLSYSTFLGLAGAEEYMETDFEVRVKSQVTIWEAWCNWKFSCPLSDTGGWPGVGQ